MSEAASDCFRWSLFEEAEGGGGIPERELEGAAEGESKEDLRADEE